MLPDAEAAPTAPTPMAEAFPSAPEPKRAARDLLPWALAAGCALFAFAVALVLRGRTHPDEVFQYLEPAHRAVYGYGEQAWEWREGIRNWFVPGLLTLVLRGLRAVAVDAHVAGPAERGRGRAGLDQAHGPEPGVHARVRHRSPRRAAPGRRARATGR